MSGINVASDSFWREFKSEVAGTLSNEQRGEIERVLGDSQVAGKNEPSDLRLSFGWFFVRFAWGPEKRSPQRIKAEQEKYPVVSRRNAPILASMFAGYMLLLLAVFAISAVAYAHFTS